MKNISTQTIILWTASKPGAFSYMLFAIRMKTTTTKKKRSNQQIVIIPNPTQYDFV